MLIAVWWDQTMQGWYLVLLTVQFDLPCKTANWYKWLSFMRLLPLLTLYAKIIGCFDIWNYWSLYVKIYNGCNPKVICVLTIFNESPGIWWHWMLPMRSTGFYVKFYNVVLGSTMLLRTKFSAHHYFEDCRRHNVTVIQYIGELCRYLLAVPEVCFDVVLYSF